MILETENKMFTQNISVSGLIRGFCHIMKHMHVKSFLCKKKYLQSKQKLE